MPYKIRVQNWAGRWGILSVSPGKHKIFKTKKSAENYVSGYPVQKVIKYTPKKKKK